MNALDLVALDEAIPAAVATKLRRARVALLFRHPFSAAVLLRCRWIVTRRVPTASIDGAHLWLNPDFVETLSPAETVGLLHHEALHVSYAHHLRRGERDPKLWNRAGDYVINGEILRLPGAKLPADGLLDAKYTGWSTERVYTNLSTPPEPPPPPAEPPEETLQDPEPESDPVESGDQVEPDSEPAGENDGDEDDEPTRNTQDPKAGEEEDPEGDQNLDTTSEDSDGDAPGSSDSDAATGDETLPAPDAPSGPPDASASPADGAQAGSGTTDLGSPSEPRPYPASFYPPVSSPDSGFGDVVEPRHADGSALEPCELDARERELAIELHQVAQACGTGSPGIARHLAAMRTPRLDIRETLLRFASEISAAHEDLSLARRNRRYLAVLPDVGMPGPFCETLGHVVAVVDTSGSIGSREVALFLGTLEEILRAFPAIRLTVVAADDQLHEVTEIPAGSAELPSPLPLSGWGGTDFRPAIAWAETGLDAPPSLLVYLTDGWGPAPQTPPSFPVLWALEHPEGNRTPASWGETAYLYPRD